MIDHRSGTCGCVYDEAQKPALVLVQPCATWISEHEADAGANAPKWDELRRRAYPPIADLADGLFWAQNGDSSRLAAYYAKIEAVKAQFPKPAEA